MYCVVEYFTTVVKDYLLFLLMIDSLVVIFWSTIYS